MDKRADDPYQAAVRVWATFRHLVLDGDDRRKEVADATGMAFIRTKALRRLALRPWKMSELTGALAIDKPYLTIVVDDLEQRGLVVRSVHPEDRRCKVVTITEAGREVAAKAEGILGRPPKALLALDAEELATLDRLTAKLS